MVWCQEEPRNMGAWHFIEPYLEWVLNQAGATQKRARYAGRPAAAATAVGVMSRHLAQLKASSTTCWDRLASWPSCHGTTPASTSGQARQTTCHG